MPGFSVAGTRRLTGPWCATQAQRAAAAGTAATVIGAITTMLFIPHAVGLVAGSLVVEQLDHRLLLLTVAAVLLVATGCLRRPDPDATVRPETL